jgi:AAA+ ATPase superfamily predicted ATPase
MEKFLNPFQTTRYVNKEYFCDRNNELNSLLRNVNNGINTTLVSPRRMGKTGLIYRFFDQLKAEKSIKYVYVDIFATNNLSDFTHVLAEAIFSKFPMKSSFGTRLFKVLQGLRPTITFDDLTGVPQVQFNFKNEGDKELTLQRILQFIDQQSIPLVIAIDEFQQIRQYPEQNLEALLRTAIQQMKSVNFIFSGSLKHTLMDIFTNVKQPFYASTQFIQLEKIDYGIYRQFIADVFTSNKKKINDEALDYIMEWTTGYTYYTQALCNRLYNFRKIDLPLVKRECAALLRDQEPVFDQYRKLLTTKQWDFLIALAKEEKITQIYGQEFLLKYKLGTSSSVRRVVNSLLEKEMILQEEKAGISIYQVYDVFLMRWMQRIY